MSSQSASELPNSQRVEKFLKYVMIENGGLYTLLGSKPMTAFAYCPVLDEDERQAIYASQTEKLKKHISLKKFHPNREDCKLLWREWKKTEEGVLGPQFLFVEFEKWDEGLFINVPLAAFILKQHYDEFKAVTRSEFDPYEVIFNFGKNSDPFWVRVQENHYLLGLLLGFGEKNAQYFQWETSQKHTFIRGASEECSASQSNPLSLTVDDLQLPHFIVYSVHDAQVEKYKAERAAIQRVYVGQDFSELTLGFLKGSRKQNQGAFSRKN